MRMHEKICPVCGITYHVPEAWEAEQKRLGPRGGWWCPNGHQRVYRQSEEDNLRAERDRLKQEQAWYEDRLREERGRSKLAERRTAAAKGQITKLKRRASAGVCPCCNRTFQDLARHMAGQHPSFVSQPDESEHVH